MVDGEGRLTTDWVTIVSKVITAGPDLGGRVACAPGDELRWIRARRSLTARTQASASRLGALGSHGQVIAAKSASAKP